VITEVPKKKVRIDKWLWAARFFKTRSLATQAVNGGLVHVNGERVKSARLVKTGDELKITRGSMEMLVVVQGLHDRRGPASQARTLYEETDESVAAREKTRELQRLLKVDRGMLPTVRPGKRDRRLIRRFIRGEE